MLLCISHNLGCRYYLGDWKNEQFTPDFHARMNWKKQDGQNWGGDFFAPESLLTADGRRVMWAWCILKASSGQSGIQSLPRELSLPEDGVLRIKPLRELDSLRHEEKRESGITIAPGTPHLLEHIQGDTMELRIHLTPNGAERFGAQVYCNGQGERGIPIVVEPGKQTLTLGDTVAPFTLPPGEAVELRVYLDKDMVEVFANDRQALVAIHPHEPGELHVKLLSEGGAATKADVTAWNMKPLWP
jgi:beta-fructofuranosidase